MQTVWLLGVIGVAVSGLAIWIYNRLVTDRNQVANAWGDIDVQLQRRHDLVPQLVAVVKGYAAHEREVLERVTQERAASRQAKGVAEKGRLETALTQDLHRLVALAEAYPDLKANGNFAQLSRDLVEVEDHLQFARRFYNGSVRQINDRIQMFPHLIVARAFDFRPAEFFAAEDDARASVGVRL